MILRLFVLTYFINGAFCQCTCPDSEWLRESTVSNETDDFIKSYITYRSEKEATTDFRLPTSLTPLHYDLLLQPFLTPDNFTFRGEVKIQVKCDVKTNQIVFHSEKLNLYYVKIIKENSLESLNITNITLDKYRTLIIIHLEEYLESGLNYAIEMKFTGRFVENISDGFFVTSYTVDSDKRYICATHFEPISARKMFPCFDEPQMKATFNVTVIRPFNMTALSNMPLLKSIENDEFWITDVFETTPKMSTYILAVTVTDYDYIETQYRNITIRTWTRANAINSTKLALSYVGPMIKFMEDYTGIPYALPKLDLIEIPYLAFGAMENWGLIIFNEYALLYEPLLGNEFPILTTVAHELAHQWFGNLVTMKWWNDIWLNEGLTSYFTDLIYANVVNKNLELQYAQSMSLYYLYLIETIRKSRPISLQDISPREIKMKIFTAISYGKGAVITRTLEKLVGVDVLRSGLKKYLSSNMYGNVNKDDLWYYISQVARNESLDVKQVMDTWALQRGFPLVTVTRDYQNNTAFVRQRIYQPKQPKFEYNENARWTIPLMFTTKNMGSFDVEPQNWMAAEEEFVQLTNSDGIPSSKEWILFNPSLHGMYLVNYDNRNWKMLINQLVTDHTVFPPYMRLYLVLTLPLLQRDGIVPLHVSYSVLEYVGKEQEDFILQHAIFPITRLAELMEPSKHFRLFQTYIQRIILPLYNKNPSQNIYNLACKAGIANCVDKVKDIFLSRSDQRNSFSEDMLCAMMRNIDAEMWEELWENTTKTNLSRNVLKSFACTVNPFLLDRLLSDVTEGEEIFLSQADKLTIFLSCINKNFFCRQLAFKMLKENSNRILKWDNVTAVFQAFSLHANTKAEVDELKELVSCIPQKYLNNNEKFYRKILKSMEEEYEKRANNLSQHYNWLKQVTASLSSPRT